MGQSTSELKRKAKEENAVVKAELEEKLNFLEIAAADKMQLKLQEILHGSEGDLQVHGGTVVEKHSNVTIDASEDASQLENVIDELFSFDILGAIKDAAKAAVQSILGNGSIGQCELQDYELVWVNNSLVRVDFYCWRYNFSNKGIIKEVENVFAYLIVKRVVDWDKVDPQVVTYCLSKSKSDPEKVKKEIEVATEIIKKIKSASLAIEEGKPTLDDSSDGSNSLNDQRRIEFDYYS